MFSLNFQPNTKRYVPKAFLSPFADGIVMACWLKLWLSGMPYRPIPSHFKPCDRLSFHNIDHVEQHRAK